MDGVIDRPAAGGLNAGVKKTCIGLLAFMALMLGLMVNKVVNPPALTQEQFKARGIFLFEKARKIKSFDLINHKDLAFTQENLQGQWGLLFLGFTHCPDVCPTTLAMLNKAMDNIDDVTVKNDTQVMLLSVDPARDTAEVLSQYMPFFNNNFIGITGDFIELLGLSGNLNAPFRKVVTDDDYTLDHSAYVFLINPQGDFQGFMKPPFDAQSFALNYLAIRKKYQDEW